MDKAQDTPDDDEQFVEEMVVGTMLAHGQFEIVKYLNSGGFGITYLAKDSLGRQVVIKECFPSTFCHRSETKVKPRSTRHLKELTSVVKSFVQEAHNLAKLDHPNIVGVHQIFEENNTAYMVLDFVEGRDLLDTLEDEDHGLTPPQIKGILKDVLGAVDYMHAQGILHRDISPDNILLDKDLRPILIDFGAAREEVTNQGRVLSALHVVKDGYSPQEFYVQGSSQTPSSDLYALGATFYHLIEGEAPPDSQARIMSVATDKVDIYRPLADRVKGYDKKVLASIDKALQVLPKDRLQSAQEWLDVLDGRRLKSRVVTTMVPVSSAVAEADMAEKKEKKLKLVPLMASVAAIAIVATFGLVGTGTIDLFGPSKEEIAATQKAQEAELAAAKAQEAEAKRLEEIEAARIETQRANELAAAKAAQETEIARQAEIAATETAAELAAAKLALEKETARLAELARLAEVAAEEAAEQRASELTQARAAIEQETARLAELARLAEVAAEEAAEQRALELAQAKTAIEQETARQAEIAAQEAEAEREAELVKLKAAQEAEMDRLEELTRRAEVDAQGAKEQREAELAKLKAVQEAETARLAELARRAEVAAEEAEAKRDEELAKLKAVQEAETARLAELARRAEVAAKEAEERRALELAQAKAALEQETARRAEVAAEEAEERRALELAQTIAALEKETARQAEVAAKEAVEKREVELAELKAAQESEINQIAEIRRQAEISVAKEAEERAAELVAARASQQGAQARVVEQVTADATGILSASSVKLPFKGRSDSNAVTEVAVGAPAWVQKGTRILAVNDVPTETFSEIQTLLRTAAPLSDEKIKSVSFVLQEEDGGSSITRESAFPVTREVIMPNGVVFVTQFDGEVWQTVVTEVPDRASNFKVGDQLIAFVATSEVIDGRTSLEEILRRELANGQDQFSFAVTRGGSLWVVRMVYSGGA